MSFRSIFIILLYNALMLTSPNIGLCSKPPNILILVSDDQSWMHAGANGDIVVKTPAFDAIAAEGTRFTRPYTACPSCAPSRAAILTSQPIWQLGYGGVLFGALPAEKPTYAGLLANNGYELGHVGKVWGPGSLYAGGYSKHPHGKAFRETAPPHTPGISNVDYAASFSKFLEQRDANKPFCFYLAAFEPHRRFSYGAGVKAGKSLKDARLPLSLPDHEVTRNDVLDYYIEIEHFDNHVATAIELLKTQNLYQNTLIIVTSDHGMAFPRAKANLYDIGTRVPLAIKPPNHGAHNICDVFVSLMDLAPTILDYANIEVPRTMTGTSLRPFLSGTDSPKDRRPRDAVYTGFERHTWCRDGGTSYPVRSIHTKKYQLIWNLEPSRWPMGEPTFDSPHQGVFGDIDNGASKTFLLENQSDPAIRPYFNLAMGKRTEYELYDSLNDPHQLKNLAYSSDYQHELRQLQRRLRKHLQQTNDPRLTGSKEWDAYPYYFGDWWKKTPGAPAPSPNAN